MSCYSRSSCGRLGGNVMFVAYATVEISSHVPSNRRAGCGSSSSCGASSSGSGFGSGFFEAPAETPRAHVFMLDLSGMTKEEVKVEVMDEGRVLEISGERKEENAEENGVKLREERGRGKFVRRFRLPRNVNVEEVKAGMEDGMLTVIVPKLEEKKPETKSVEISG
ncbi:17.6 kDa class I heat shock protein 3-like protein [Drosera capensis]